jgi:hypothetical protein
LQVIGELMLREEAAGACQRRNRMAGVTDVSQVAD